MLQAIQPGMTRTLRRSLFAGASGLAVALSLGLGVGAAAAQTAAVGLDHRQGGADRHRRVKGIAAGRQGFQPGHGSGWVGTGNGRLAGLLIRLQGEAAEHKPGAQ